MSKRLLVTDKVHDILIEGLQNLGFDVAYQPQMPYAEVKAKAKEYHGLIINSKVICDKVFLEQNKHLEFIGRLGSGLDIIDLEAADRLGIEIINSPEGNANAVAEHVIGMLLCLKNHICRANTEVKNFQWHREINRGSELHGKTVGIIGCGHTGSAVAQKLSSWNVTLLAYDKYKKDLSIQYPYIRQTTLQEVLSESDIISIHLPLTPETDRMIDISLFSPMSKKPVLINSSRGQIVHTDDLLTALDQKLISGACLDVIENEKMDQLTEHQQQLYERLFTYDNVLLTPHIAGWTHESLVKIAEYLLIKIQKFYQL